MMRNSLLAFFLLCLLSGGLSAQQPAATECDTSYIKIFYRSNFKLEMVPCDSFVVIGKGYYNRIANRYNATQQLVVSQTSLLDNLERQLQLSDSIAGNYQRIVDAQGEAIKGFKASIDSLDKELSTSIELTRQANENAREAVKIARRRQWLAIGGVGGFILGVVVGILVGG